jgi:hypothetical protein
MKKIQQKKKLFQTQIYQLLRLQFEVQNQNINFEKYQINRYQITFKFLKK